MTTPQKNNFRADLRKSILNDEVVIDRIRMARRSALFYMAGVMHMEMPVGLLRGEAFDLMRGHYQKMYSAGANGRLLSGPAAMEATPHVSKHIPSPVLSYAKFVANEQAITIGRKSRGRDIQRLAQSFSVLATRYDLLLKARNASAPAAPQLP